MGVVPGSSRSYGLLAVFFFSGKFRRGMTRAHQKKVNKDPYDEWPFEIPIKLGSIIPFLEPKQPSFFPCERILKKTGFLKPSSVLQSKDSGYFRMFVTCWVLSWFLRFVTSPKWHSLLYGIPKILKPTSLYPSLATFQGACSKSMVYHVHSSHSPFDTPAPPPKKKTNWATKKKTIPGSPKCIKVVPGSPEKYTKKAEIVHVWKIQLLLFYLKTSSVWWKKSCTS